MHEALGKVETQPRLSREEKGKAPLNVDGVAYVARQRALKVPLDMRLNLVRNAKFDAKPRWLRLTRERLFPVLTSLL